MFKRLTALFLALLMTAAACACSSQGGGEPTPSGTQPAQTAEAVTEEETTVNYLDTLPEKDMTGMQLRILGVDYETRRNFPLDSENGELVNDALYVRNRDVEEKYGAKIVNYGEENDGNVTSKAQKSVTSGDDEYDVLISTLTGTMTSLSLAHCLYNLTDVPYLSLEEGWWSKEMYSNLKIHGKLYFTMSDFAPMKFYAPYVMCYNRKLADDYNIGDITDEVINGSWTLDRLIALTDDVTRDLDGDGALTKNDFWAYAHVKTGITSYAHYTGAGMQLCTLDKDGTPTVSLDSDRSVSVINKLASFLGDGFIEYTDMAETYNMFIEGRALFFGNSTSNVIAYFREMKDDFSIIPVPKYDEKQELYYSYINTYVRGGVAIPTTCTHIEEVGLLLEVLSYLSYGDVRNALYETTMKQKVARDEVSGIILDMIFDNCYIDLNGIYDFGGSATVIKNAVMDKKEFMSGYAAIKDKIATSIADTLAKFD